jgi:hypothetical protein
MKARLIPILVVMISMLATGGICYGQQALCIFSVSPSVLYFEPEGGNAEVTVTPSSPNCSFTARTSYRWITVSSARETGKSVVTVKVEAASNLAQRVGSVMVDGTQIEITQKARNLISW